MATRARKSVNLALQGGGSHGAFTWGVLDAIAEHGGVSVDGISATSAGAMNASVFAYGHLQGGDDGAREALEKFWWDISATGAVFSPVHHTPFDVFTGGLGHIDSTASFMWFDALTRMISPYEFNPLNMNPLRDVLSRHVDFAALDACGCIKLFVCATNVRTNKVKIFDNEHVTQDAVLASACLPMIFQAVEIDGEAYWDGGYMGNPAMFPLLYETETDDILLVHINPIERAEIPKTAHEISNRINEVSFNSSLLRELRSFEFAKRIVEEEWIKPEYREHFKFHQLRMHSIGADDALSDLSAASKLSPDWQFLCNLRDRGRAAAQAWLNQNYKHIGKRATMDMREEFE